MYSESNGGFKLVNGKKGLPLTMVVVLFFMGFMFSLIGISIGVASLTGNMAWSNSYGESMSAVLPGLLFLFLFGGAGACMLFFGVNGLIAGVKEARDKQWLLDNGVRIIVEIIQVEEVHNIRINGRYPIYLIGLYNNMEYNSDYISDAVARFCGRAWDVGDTVMADMLVDNISNPEKYFLDSESLRVVQKINENIVQEPHVGS